MQHQAYINASVDIR
ncbi:TPA: DUF3113 family protein, partial [Staphylococcus aureus]|nr:DUF3113 family protein [Staphylococcus aureus]